MLDHSDKIDVYNLGVSGATAQSGNALTWKDQEQYDDLMKHYRCDVAIVQLGTNISRANIAARISDNDVSGVTVVAHGNDTLQVYAHEGLTETESTHTVSE